MPSSLICVDASLVVRLIINPQDRVVRAQWRQWDGDKRQVVAPTLLHYEVTNVLYLYQRLERLSEVTVRKALEAALALPVKLYGTKNLHRRAVDMAVGYGLKATYDAHYLALAEQLEAEFWTGDRRLARSVQAHLEWVHLLE